MTVVLRPHSQHLSTTYPEIGILEGRGTPRRSITIHIKRDAIILFEEPIGEFCSLPLLCRDFGERKSPAILNTTTPNGREFIDYIPPNSFPNSTLRITNCVRANVKKKLAD